MKKRLLSIFAMAFVAFSASAAVGDDLTSKYLQNADFSQDTPLQQGICTYAKDMATNGVTLFGMQPVTAWTASNPSDNAERTADDYTMDARACGVFELGKQYLADYTGNDEDISTPIFCGGTGFLTPAPTEEAGGPTSGNALGMVAVWGADVHYTQAVTLPAGAYTISIPVYNNGGEGTVGANYFGFITDDGTSYVAENTTWAVGKWETMTINILLKQETTGVISLGYKGPGGSGSMPHLYVTNIQILEGDAAAMQKEEVDALKVTLAELLEAAEELSVNTDAEQAVYDNDDATLEQVQAAIDALKEKNANAMTDFTDYFINNAHFAMGTPMDNGVCTYDYDMEKNSTTYYGMQPIQDWTASNPSTNTVEGVNNGRASGLFAVGSESGIWLGSVGDVVPATKANGATEGNLFGFISVWSGSASYTQNVTLPAGSYTITIPTYNERGTGAVAKNLCGFIADDGTEYLATTTTFTVGKWSNETIKFKLEDETSGVITIGYQASNAGSGSMPHLFIDEFTLMFNGKTDIAPSLIALNGAIRNGENYLDTDEPYEQAKKEALESAINAGNELKNSGTGTDEENTAAATAINNAITDVKASISTYKSFDSFINGTLENAIEKYGEGDMEDFSGELADDKSTYEDAYADGSYTTEQIEEIINGFSTRVAEAVKAALDKAAADGGSHNIDITCLFADKNLDFAKNTVDGWNNETGTSAFLSRVQTAEVWNQTSFNCYVTLENLPAGVYQLTIPGFYRSADNVTNYNELTEGNVVGSAYAYVGGNTVLMHNVAEDQYLLHAEAADDNHSGIITDGELYVVNSNANAHYYFYDQTDADCSNTVKGALAETGNLVIGVKGENLEGNEWTVWGAATLTYLGTDGMEDVLYAQMQQLVTEAQTLVDVASQVSEGDDKMQAALDAAEGCSSTDRDEIIATIGKLNDAIAYAKESQTAINTLSDLKTVYSDYLMSSVESDETSFPELMETITTALEDGEFESNDQINGYCDQIKSGFTTYVQYPVLEGSSEENPGDITAAILNPGFEGVTGTTGGEYWTQTRVGGNEFGYQAGVYESWNTDSFDIHQTITGLQPGYYRLKVQSFFRAANANQDNADFFSGDTCQCAAFLYANEYQKQIINQVERGDEGAALGTDEASVIYGDNAEFYVPTDRTGCAKYFETGLYWNTLDCYVGEDGTLTIGIQKTAHVYGDWCPFDNFQLYYLGTDAPTAIEGVEAETTVAGNAAIYDLSGRRVARAQRGIYIINGHKVIK